MARTYCIYENTYWNSKGKYPEKESSLSKLIPESGEISNTTENPKLELFRRACNCYYDLYNNGLCNPGSEFFEIFGFEGECDLTPEIVKGTERRMNKLILDAAKEQGIH